MEGLEPFLWLAVGVFIVTGVVQLLFPVEVYERARESNLSTSNKGRFAYTVESLYQIKTKGLAADSSYWWHITWFNTSVSFSISAIVIFGVAVLIIIFLVIAFLIALSMLSN